ncbi:hypothetical protein IFR05_003174 [Cadophora sp. M221]|nr:hypothetical protein IFR05_003174 [Cadophora sp. M221]
MDTLAHQLAKRMAATYATKQMEFWIKEVMFPFTVHTVLQLYQDPAFLAALKSQKPAKLKAWFAKTLTDPKITHCLRNPWGKAISVDFFMHKAVHSDAGEERLRVKLRKWAVDLISSTCTDLYRYGIQMREGEEKSAWCIGQIMAKLNEFPMSKAAEGLHIDWLALPASQDFGRITRVRTTRVQADHEDIGDDDDASDILDWADSMPDR